MRIIFEIFWLVVVVIGTIYSIILGYKSIYKYIIKKLETKSIRKSTVTVVVKGKYFAPGPGYEIPRAGTIIQSASYRVEVIYNEQLYILHNEQVFNSVNAGDFLEMILVEKVNRNGNIIDSYLEVISSKSSYK